MRKSHGLAPGIVKKQPSRERCGLALDRQQGDEVENAHGYLSPAIAVLHVVQKPEIRRPGL